MIALYIPRASPVHRAPAGLKLAALFAFGAVAAFIKPLWALAAAFVGVAGLHAFAGLPIGEVLRALRPVLWILAILFVMQWALSGVQSAAAITLRIASLVLAATLVTLTTPLSAMIAAVERAAAPLARFGFSPAKFGLAVGLTLRFIPVLMNDYREICDARAARAARRPGLGAAGPLLIKTLRMTDALSDAIAARGFEDRDRKGEGHEHS
jgi:biotin transport system permease protein